MTNIMDLNPEEIPEMLTKGNLKLSVIGCGVMGLPLACLYADKGVEVYGVDANVELVDKLKRGVIPNSEPGLRALLQKVLRMEKFHPTTDVKSAVNDSEIIMIVISASVSQLGIPDYFPLRKIAEDLGTCMTRGSLIIQSSTTGPGVTEEVVKERIEALSNLKAEQDFGFSYSPLRGAEGSLLRDLVSYPRVVGAVGPKSLAISEAVLKTVVEGGIVRVRDIKTAETVKLFENFYRFAALVISHELAVLCEKIGVDYVEVLKAATTQPFCHLLKPSIGVGGHLPKDAQLLQNSAENVNFSLRTLKVTLKVNDILLKHGYALVIKALRRLGKPLRRSRILVLGLSFKPNVKNTRNSYSLKLANELLKRGAEVVVYDPYFTRDEIRGMGFKTSLSLKRTLRDVDCVIIATPHDVFKNISLSDFRSPESKTIAIVDFGRIFNREEVEKANLIYVGVGADSVD
ncbi:nucleotide sugar dehydrogenase [Candidatus Bathyarchaeota archaeon]|nr:nucleotide sugar dehydrogenase [Candidatus Bathyarchaeota archaeon]MBS7612659.1 nucleotide sugar dehydrogenase [Candidatus Bathyarchaeota archaeon]MBS7617833.1 nucleotide sugar dehydrogenase [Candidatus Bathyarchaeota archaeon]